MHASTHGVGAKGAAWPTESFFGPGIGRGFFF